MSKKCSRCGTELADNALFCTECGVRLSDDSQEKKEEGKQASAPEEEKKPAVCPKCGKELKNEGAFCSECGASLKEAKEEKSASGAVPVTASAGSSSVSGSYSSGSHNAPSAAPQQTVPKAAPAPVSASYTPSVRTVSDPACKPVGVFGYLGLFLLFAIPIVGAIACLILAFAPQNKSLKNFARAQIIWFLIGVILFVFFCFLAKSALSGLVKNIESSIQEATGSDISFSEGLDLSSLLSGKTDLDSLIGSIGADSLFDGILSEAANTEVTIKTDEAGNIVSVTGLDETSINRLVSNLMNSYRDNGGDPEALLSSLSDS